MELFAADIRARLEAASHGNQTEDNQIRRSFTFLCWAAFSNRLSSPKETLAGTNLWKAPAPAALYYMAVLSRSIFTGQLDQVPNYLNRE